MIYLDTSALVKLVVEEAKTAALRRFVAQRILNRSSPALSSASSSPMTRAYLGLLVVHRFPH